MYPRRDILWKDIMEFVFEDFLRFVFMDADRIFDWSKGIIFLDKELTGLLRNPAAKTGTRYVDKLVQVHLRNGKEILIHLEVQGYTKRDQRGLFGERMFTYFYRILDRFRKPIVAISIYSGNDACKMPTAYEYELLDTSIRYKFNTLRIQDYSDEALAASDNIFALVLLVARQELIRGRDFDVQLLDKKLIVLRLLSEWGALGNKRFDALLLFLNDYVKFRSETTRKLFESRVNLLTKNNNAMDIFEHCAMFAREDGKALGLKEGRREGRKEGLNKGKEKGRQLGKKENAEKTITHLLQTTDFSEKRIATATDTTIAFVRKIKKGLAGKEKCSA